MNETPVILSLELEATSADSSITLFELTVGQPFLEREGQWRCVVLMDGFQRPLRVAGGDPFQALVLAIDYVRWLLRDFLEQGGSLKCEGENFPLKAYFFKPPT